MKKRFLSFFLAVAMVVSVLPQMTLPSHASSVPPYKKAVLNVDLSKIKQVGCQSGGQACACFALAYCTTILDGKVHYYSEYNLGTNQNDAVCDWSKGKFTNGYYPSSISVAYKYIYNQIVSGNPVVIRVSGTRSSHHYVAVVGVEKVTSYETLSPSNFLILDSAVSKFTIENMGTVGYNLKIGSSGTYQLVYNSTGKTVGFSSLEGLVNEYALTFNGNGGSDLGSYTITGGDAFTIPEEVPARFGYHFVNWEWEGFHYQPGDIIVPEGDMTLTAGWERNYLELESSVFDSGSWDEQSFSILHPGAGRWVQVTCDESGYYQFCGLNDTSLDTKASLYDSAGNLLISDDDSGGNWQFKLEHYLETGLTYYLHIEPYSSDAEGEFHYAIMKGYPIYRQGETVANCHFYRMRSDNYRYMAVLDDWTPTKEGYYFQGWAWTQDAMQASYQPGETIDFTTAAPIVGGTMLYPVWGNANGVTGISMETFQLEYSMGEDFNWENLSVNLQYSDGSTTRVDSVWDLDDSISISGFDNTTPGYQTVTFYCGSLSTTFTVWVCPGGSCGNDLVWEIGLGSTYVLTISGTGAMTNYSSPEEVPWREWGPGIVIIGQGVTSIGDYAFADIFLGVDTVTISDSVQTIGYFAFRGAHFDELILPEGLTSINNGAFEYCNNLTSVTIPDSVTNIGQYAFRGCSSLTSITIPEGVTRIEYATFADCTRLSFVTIPTIVDTIGSCAFYGCTSLTDVYFGGTEDRWLDISISSDNEALLTATLHAQPRTAIAYGNPGEDHMWVLYNNGTVTILGNGAMYDYVDCPWSKYDRYITNIVIQSGVTTIGDNAFYDFRNLRSVTLPDGLTSIGDYAFYRCECLQSITLPDSVTEIGDSVFAHCSSLQSVMIPDGVTGIGNRAFYNCSGLTEIAIPYSVVSIDHYAFRYCTGLTDVYYGGTQAQWAQIEIGSDNECLTEANIHFAEATLTGISITPPAKTQYWVGEELDTAGMVVTVSYSDGSTETVTDYTVSGYDANTSGEQTVTITYGEHTDSFTVTVASLGGTCGENLTWTLDGTGKLTISGTGAMADYEYDGTTAPWNIYGFYIASVELQPGVTTIGDAAFAGCYNLTAVTIPEGVTSIGHVAFRECENLLSVTLPDSVISIDGSVFDWCSNLMGIWVGKNNPSYSNDECGVLFNKDKTELLFAPGGITGSYTIPDGVTVIGDSAFFACDDLISLIVPDGVTSIGRSAVSCCWSLTTVVIPNSVTTIDEFAFFDDISLTYVYYGGTAEQWEQILIEGENEPLTSAVLHTTEITGISVTTPTKTEYAYGEALDTAGMVVTAIWSDGTTTEVTEGYEVTGFDPNTAGEQTVTVTYEGFTGTFCVCVQEQILYGDVNGDGEVNVRDRAVLTRYLADWEDYEEIDLQAADVDRDGEVSARDRAILTRYLADWENYPELPYTG